MAIVIAALSSFLLLPLLLDSVIGIADARVHHYDFVVSLSHYLSVKGYSI